MAKIYTMGIGVPGVELWLEYNASNLRILRVEWTIPEPGIAIRAQIWDNDVLVFDRTEGQGSGSENVPGSYRLEEITEDDNTYLVLPSNIRYRFNMQTIG
jgi:hypothetical protein